MRRSKALHYSIKLGANLRAQNRLQEIRARIDELDSQISTMLNERLNLAVELTEVKAQLGMPIKDRGREEQVLQKVSQAGSNEYIRTAIREAYERLMELSRQVQLDTPVGSSESTLYFPQITIVGLGLIGGAIARLVKRRLPQTKIVAFDREDVLREALAENVIDQAASDLKQAVSRSALIILAASPSQNLALLQEIAPFLSKRKLVIDVTSTKGKIGELADTLNLKGADFVGGHPMFGSEKTGFAASQEVKAEGSTFCVVPTAKSSEISVRRLIHWLTDLNFQVETVGALEHDAILARTSHLVQLLCVVLGAQLYQDRSDEQLKKLGRLSGPSLKQLSRLMKTAPDMWREIIEQNKTEVICALTELETALSELLASIESDGGAQIDQLFSDAGKLAKVFDELNR